MRLSLYITIATSAILIFTMFVFVNHPIGEPIRVVLKKLNFINSISSIHGVSNINNQDHIKGDKESNVLILEYSDYTCYFCSQTRPALDKIIETYPKLLLAYRHYIPYSNRNGIQAAVAAECVADIGGEDAFWEYTNLLYKNQSTLNEKELIRLAIGLNISAMDIRSCLKNEKLKEEIIKKSEEIQGLGALGTPYILIVVNGVVERLVYSQTFEELIILLREVVGENELVKFTK